MKAVLLCRGPGVAEKRQLAEHKVAVLRRALQHHPGCLRLQTLLLEALEAAERGEAVIQAYWQQVGLMLGQATGLDVQGQNVRVQGWGYRVAWAGLWVIRPGTARYAECREPQACLDQSPTWRSSSGTRLGCWAGEDGCHELS